MTDLNKPSSGNSWKPAVVEHVGSHFS